MLVSNCTKNERNSLDWKKKKCLWEKSPLYGDFPHSLNKNGFAYKKTAWIRSQTKQMEIPGLLLITFVIGQAINFPEPQFLHL